MDKAKNQSNERARDVEGRFEAQNQSKQQAGRSSHQGNEKPGRKMEQKSRNK